MEERIQKIMAHAGIGSRRACEQLIEDGRVRINGRRAVLGEKADPAVDRIEFDGQALSANEGKVYLMLHKPRGVLSTVSTPEDVQTVVDLVDHPSRLYPVGRLDRESEGLILLTNDGELANKLTHPRYGHEKEYRVLVPWVPSDEQLDKWRSGLEMPDGYQTQPVQVRIIGRKGNGAWLRVVMKEGRKRQIRETARVLGLPIVTILRTRLGPLNLGSLRSGKWRELTTKEISELRKYVSRSE